MNKLLVSTLLLLVTVISGFSQDQKKVLLTIDGSPIYDTEFKRVYNKNLDLVQDESQKDVDGYLELFINYKLKVKAAYDMKMDKKLGYLEEFAKYEEQLSRNYIFEDRLTEELALEAYQRGLEEIKASHILINSNYSDTSQDTLVAYKKIITIREKAIRGEDFTMLAKKYSEEPSASERGGDLGYFTAFSMVYPFETVAYNTEVGEISEIVRTSFGYHIIKIEDRRNRVAPITVSHIMVAISKNNDRTFDPYERINEVYALLQQGESFESLAKQYSDDKNSARKGGKLNKFSKGDLRSVAFENAAYELKNIGDISKPMKSDFGWHIIRLEEQHEIPVFADQKIALEKRVAKGDRAKIVTNETNKIIKEKYGFSKGEPYLDYFENYVGEEVMYRKWRYDSVPPPEKRHIFTIGTRKLTFVDFAEYINKRQLRTKPYKDKRKLLSDMFIDYETFELKKYFRDQLEYENEAYASIINEYREGLLIFDVMNYKVWMEARIDTVGLRNYFNHNRDQYTWKDRVNAIIVSTPDEAVAKQVVDLLEEVSSPDAIKKQFNNDIKIQVIVSEGVYEIDRRELPSGFEPKMGVSRIYTDNDSFIVVMVTEIIPSGYKELMEVRGKLLNSYQNYLEKEWINELRNKADIKVNKKVLKQIKKELKD